MPKLDQLNTWGKADSGYDPQRSDLWQLNFDLVVSNLRNQLARLSGSTRSYIKEVAAALPTADNVPFYARRIDFPASKTSVSAVRRDNSLFQAPSYDEAPGQLVVNFLHEVVTKTQGYRGSTMWALFEAWRAFVRAGQQLSPDSTELALSLSEAADPGTLQVRAAWPIYIDLLSAPFTPNSTNPISSMDLQVVSSYRAINCWPSEIQLNPLSHTEQGTHLEIRVSFTTDGVQSL